MGFNFPNAPVHGDVFAAPTGPTWRFINGAWQQTSDTTTPVSVSGAVFFASRVEAELATIEGDVDVIGLHGYHAAGDGGAARYRRVVSEPAHLGKLQSAGDIWWELVIEGGEMVFEQFGGVADGDRTTGIGTDNIPAWNRAMSMYSLESSQIPYGELAPMVPRLLFGIGIYYFSQTLDIVHNIHIRGRATGHWIRMGGSQFTFPPDTTGIRVQSTNTSGPDGPASGSLHASGKGSIVEGISIRQSGTDLTKHGFQMRANATFRDCTSVFAPGNAFHIEAGVGSPTAGGNANSWIMDSCHVHTCGGDALHIAGGDTQQGRNYNFTTEGTVGGCGIYDQSWIGVTHVGPSITGYGNCGVHRGGIHYLLISNGAGAGGLWEPGTNDRIWYPYRTGNVLAGRYEEWVEGADYHLMLPWFISQYASTIYNVYVEGGTPGHGGTVVGGNGAFTTPTNRIGTGGSNVVPALQTKSGVGASRSFVAGTKGYDKNGTLLSAYVGTADLHDETGMNILEHNRGNEGLYTYKYYPGAMIYQGFNQKIVFHVSTVLSTELYGRPWTPTHNIISFSDYALRDPTNSATWRVHGIRAAIPAAAGEYARGEMRWNVNPTAGGKVGWVCTTSGALASSWVMSTNYALNGYIKTGAGRFYRCTLDPSGIPSTVEPVHVTGTVVGGDGYGWDYLTIGDPIAAWVTGTQYPVDTIIRNSTLQKVYRCVAAPVDPETSLLEPSTVVPTHATGTLTTPDDYVWAFVEQLWLSGTNYAVNDIRKTAAGRSYMVSVDPPGAPLSVNEPSHMLEQVIGADGYGWTYVSTGAPSLAKAWVSGRNYAISDLVRSSAGRTYLCGTDPGGFIKSTIEPVHTTGSVTGADGYRWTYVETLWLAGIDYAAAAVVRNSAGHTYSCTVDPGAVPAAIEPVHSRHKVYPDGYGWTYITSTEAVWKAFGVIDP